MESSPFWKKDSVYIKDIVQRDALQRTNTENSKQIFPEKELHTMHSHSPNFLIHVSVSDLYIPTIDLPLCCRKYGDQSGEYINRSQTHECRN